MFIQPKPRTYSGDQDPELITISQFKGMNLLATASQIDINESPDMLNMQLDDLGALDKRNGYTRLFPASLGSGSINGFFLFNKNDGTQIRLLAWGTNLYTQSGSSQPTSIYSSLANARVKFFVMNDKCYIKDGTNYLQYDGTSIVTVESVAYIPTITSARAPTGGGTVLESINLLQPGFKDSFTGTAGVTAYQLSLTGLDATLVTAVVNGANKVETTDFTVNRTTGVVTFTVAPGIGTNNVVITAYKTIAGNADRVKKCTIFAIFGGDNDSRIFLAGHPTLKNWRLHSGLYDPSYFPDLNYAKVGLDNASIKDMRRQDNTLVILKERIANDTSIWYSKYLATTNTSGVTTVSFTLFPLSSDAGCDCGEASTTINDVTTFIDKVKGVYQLEYTNVRDQRNIMRISDKINRLLLAEANLQNAVSFNFGFKYGICVNGNVYVYDYRQSVWYVWNNINASCFFEIAGELYFGSNSIGMIYKFYAGYNDDNTAINAYWKTKLMSFGKDEYRKLISRIFYSLKPATATSITVSFQTNTATLPVTLLTNRRYLFDYSRLDYSQFTYSASIFPTEYMQKIRQKKIQFIQFTFSNNILGESMGIPSVAFQYLYQGIVKN